MIWASIVFCLYSHWDIYLMCHTNNWIRRIAGSSAEPPNQPKKKIALTQFALIRTLKKSRECHQYFLGAETLKAFRLNLDSVSIFISNVCFKEDQKKNTEKKISNKLKIAKLKMVVINTSAWNNGQSRTDLFFGHLHFKRSNVQEMKRSISWIG